MTFACPVCGHPLPARATLTATVAFPRTCPNCGSYVARQPAPGPRLLFSLLYNVVFFGGLVLGLALGSWWPVAVLCPMAVFVLPRVLAWVSPVVAVSAEGVRRARRANLLLLAGFILLVLVLGLASQG